MKMSKLWMPILMVSALFTASCNDDDPETTPQQKNVTETVVADDRFNTLEAAVLKAGLANTLATTQNITVFAPTNDAFNAAGLTPAVIASAADTTVRKILQYHVLASRVSAAQVPAGPNAAVPSLLGPNVFATRNSKVFINGVEVTSADINATNGVIHVVNRVLLPPAGNIVQTAQADTSLSYLVAAVIRAGASGTNIAAALSAAGPLTVFAPDNNAFRRAGFVDIAAIQAADANTLKNILLYHVLAARVFSSDLTENLQPTTQGGGTVTITLTGGPKVKGNSNPAPSNITATDIVTTNGVIHKIDRVLLP
jgi:uncharacterized surface protein with fasciclin (FAS1) repeats